MLKDEKNEFLTTLDTIPNRCSIVVNKNLTGYHLANAIAVIALTAGRRHPVLLGCDLIDASGETHPGLIPTGIPILCMDEDGLHQLRREAKAKNCDVVDFTVEGQQTKDYDEYLEMTSMIPADRLRYLGIAIIGSKNAVSKLTKHCDIFR
jgi:hypothetical protein